MIKIESLTEEDKGKRVMYTGKFKGKWEEGVIKSWNDKYIFVVYACGSAWAKHKNFTGVATPPEDLVYVD